MPLASEGRRIVPNHVIQQRTLHSRLKVNSHLRLIFFYLLEFNRLTAISPFFIIHSANDLDIETLEAKQQLAQFQKRLSISWLWGFTTYTFHFHFRCPFMTRDPYDDDVPASNRRVPISAMAVTTKHDQDYLWV